eukprot:gene23896-biopygen7346
MRGGAKRPQRRFVYSTENGTGEQQGNSALQPSSQILNESGNTSFKPSGMWHQSGSTDTKYSPLRPGTLFFARGTQF